MIVYGDPKRDEGPRQIFAGLREQLSSLACDRSASQQVDIATSLLMASGELAQGLLDDECRLLGFDEWTPLAERCAALTMTAAKLAIRSLSLAAVAEFQSQLDDLFVLNLPETVTIKTPEGYAFYAVYPQLYAMASQVLASTDPQQLTVIGLRSIGTSLAAVVAVAANATTLPITLRPHGQPFRRQLKLGPLLEAQLLANRNGRFAIVDEGPGLSGSSFMAVVDWLLERGISEDQIDIFPSHGNNPGPQASPEQLTRWRRLRRHWFDFENTKPAVLAEAFQAPALLNGAPDPWRDIAAGKWREVLLPDKSQWPPANVQQERRKFLLHERPQHQLAKFAGLGPYGQRAFHRAAKLSAAGFIPPVESLTRGFVVGTWLPDARPLLDPSGINSSERATLLERLAQYLEFLAIEFPARHAGASALELSTMARSNLSERLGSEAADELFDSDVIHSALSNTSRPVETDNKMQPWEWLQTGVGVWLKADALDHHADHQCVGPQDIAWDVAGAIVELELSHSESEQIRRRLAPHSQICRSREASRFYELCYLAFQIGYCTLSANSLGHLPDEALRFATRATFYEQRLATMGLAVTR